MLVFAGRVVAVAIKLAPIFSATTWALLENVTDFFGFLVTIALKNEFLINVVGTVVGLGLGELRVGEALGLGVGEVLAFGVGVL